MMAFFFLGMVIAWFYLFFLRMGKKRTDAGFKARMRRIRMGSIGHRGASSSGSGSPSSAEAGPLGREAGAAGAHGASPLHIADVKFVNPIREN